MRTMRAGKLLNVAGAEPHAKTVRVSAARALRQARRERVDLVSAWGAPQGTLAEDPVFGAYIATFAPSYAWKSSAYARRVYLQTTAYDEDDEPGFQRGNKVDLRRALAAALVAGWTGEPESVDAQTEVAAVHLAYRPDERVSFLSLDLDGNGKAPAEVIQALRREIGDDAMLVTSGSGRVGRYRVWLRLRVTKTVDALQSLAKRWLSGLGLAVGSNGDVEVFPSTKCGRAPFGLGGCTRFDLDLSRSGHERPLALFRAYKGLSAIELRALALRQPELADECAPRKTPRSTASANQDSAPNAGKKGVSRRFVADRRPPTPKAKRELWAQGVEGKGQRDAAKYALAVDCRYRRCSQESTVERLQEWIESGAFDRSRAAQRRGGIAREIRDLPRFVRVVFKTHQLPGRPEPLALSASETARVAEHARIAAEASGFSEQSLRSLLFGILPLFKAAQAAGLPKVRIHKQEWERASGSRYSKLRDACGVFALARKDYRSAESLRARGLSANVAAECAYAQCWQTSFPFDV